NGGDDGVSLKANCGLLSTRMALIKAVEAEDGQELSGPDSPQDKSKVSSPDNKLGNNTQSTGAPGAGGSIVGGQPAELPPKPGGSGTEEQVRKLEVVDTSGEEVAGDKKDHEDGTATGPQHQSVDQLSSSSSSSGSSGTEGVKQPSLKENSEISETSNSRPQEEEVLPSESDSPEEEADVTILSEQETEELVKKKEDKKNAINEAPTETHGNPTNNAEIQTAIPTTQVNGDSSPETLEDVQQPEEVQGEKDSNNNSQTKSAVTIAANQHNETSADHGESGPPSPTVNGDAADNEADKSTEDGTPNSDPASDAPGTAEGKQNENKDANPKETPVTATAMKTTTVTTGDSDGSTAVSHTTSPLLLLLLVACAAAVVAA
ncbi:mucin-associated surface protein (MASP), partial [Trypanosoma cruzi]